MTDPTQHAEMEQFLHDLATSHEHVTVIEVGRSVEDKSLLLVRIKADDDMDPWRVLLIGVQHGDEPAGKDAILVLVRDAAENPGTCQHIPNTLARFSM